MRFQAFSLRCNFFSQKPFKQNITHKTPNISLLFQADIPDSGCLNHKIWFYLFFMSNLPEKWCPPIFRSTLESSKLVNRY